VRPGEEGAVRADGRGGQAVDPSARWNPDAKPRLDCIPPFALEQAGRVYDLGERKYGDARNWEDGMKASRLYASLQRHLTRWRAGEDDDPEDGAPHLAKAAWGVLALLDQQERRPDLDDRARQPADAEPPAPWPMPYFKGGVVGPDGEPPNTRWSCLHGPTEVVIWRPTAQGVPKCAVCGEEMERRPEPAALTVTSDDEGTTR
jgi:hypothetical protein